VHERKSVQKTQFACLRKDFTMVIFDRICLNCVRSHAPSRTTGWPFAPSVGLFGSRSEHFAKICSIPSSGWAVGLPSTCLAQLFWKRTLA
jgi:hypothetical protein